MIFNAIVLMLVRFIGQRLGQSLAEIAGFWQPSLIILCLLVIFYCITKGFYLKIDKLEKLQRGLQCQVIKFLKYLFLVIMMDLLF